MKNVHIAFVQPAMPAMSIRDRLQRVANTLAQAPWGCCDVGLLVAPEYYFRNPGQIPVSSYHLSIGEHKYILECLTRLSNCHPKVIMIPGTVAWQQPASAPIAKGVSPSYGGLYANKKSLVNQFSNPASMDIDFYFKLNTALIFYQGNYGYIDKMGDWHESERDNILVYRESDLKRLTTLPVKLCIEICLDHASGRFLSESPRDEVDIHVVLSDYTFSNKAHFRAKDGGIVVHSSSKERAEVPSDKYSYDPATRLTTHRTKGTVTSKNGLRLEKTVPNVFHIMHNKRVSNIFKRSGNEYKSLKIQPFGNATFMSGSVEIA
jgi:hypothetical protein